MSILRKIKLTMHHGNAVRTNRLSVYNISALFRKCDLCWTFWNIL